nr:hypothetical protein [uncultured Desulfobulbus sp.]
MDILENSRRSATGIKLSTWERDEPQEVIDQVHQRQAQQLFYQAWVHNLGSIIVACCATIAVWRAVDHVHLLIWLTLFTLIYICRWGIALRFAKVAPQGPAVRNWVRLQFGTIVASAVAYGIPAVFLWPEGYPLEQMAWVITVTAITAASSAAIAGN